MLYAASRSTIDQPPRSFFVGTYLPADLTNEKLRLVTAIEDLIRVQSDHTCYATAGASDSALDLGHR